MSLVLPILFDRGWVFLPIAGLVIRVRRSPFLLTVANALGIHRVGLDLLAVIIGSSLPLAIRLATDVLHGSVQRWLKRLPTIAAAAGRHERLLRLIRNQSLRESKNEAKVDLETDIEYVPRPRPWAAGTAATGGGECCGIESSAGLANWHHWLRLSPARMAPFLPGSNSRAYCLRETGVHQSLIHKKQCPAQKCPTLPPRFRPEFVRGPYTPRFPRTYLGRSACPE